jgi:glycosyltransferase involved in cell wall biosynthesis
MSILQDVDLVLSPSSFVTNSFLERGFKPEQILRNVYPVDLQLFHPRAEQRPKNRPLTIVSTASLSLRKGTPYLLEAFRIVQKEIPEARFLLTQLVEDSVKEIVRAYSDLNIEWSPPLPHSRLADRLRAADLFVLPSLEEGLARTCIEALACGLPIVVTPNTGANDWIDERSGEVVPVRDSAAIAAAILKWNEKVRDTSWEQRCLFDPTRFSFDHFAAEFVRQLKILELI